jgi:hypothetical protein
MSFAAVVGIVAVKALRVNRLLQGSTRCDVTCRGSTRWKRLNPGGLAKTAESGSNPEGWPFSTILKSTTYKFGLVEVCRCWWLCRLQNRLSRPADRRSFFPTNHLCLSLPEADPLALHQMLYRCRDGIDPSTVARVRQRVDAPILNSFGQMSAPTAG